MFRIFVSDNRIVNGMDANELKRWAAQTAKAYDNLAREFGKDAPAFYTQSNLTAVKHAPDIFIMGINPGSVGTYKEQCEQDYWQLDGKPMDGEHLLKGNPSWGERFGWPYWLRLRQLFDEEDNPLDDERNFVVTNATFFATSKAKDLYPKFLPATLSYTLELIELLKPKTIVVLSGKSLLKTIKAQCDATHRPFEYARPFASVGNIFTGHLDGIPCCGIPHPSASLFREERELMRRIVMQVHRRERINIEDYKDLLDKISRRRKRTGRLSKEETANLYDALVLRMQKLPYINYESHKDIRRYDLNNGLQLTIANNSTTHCIGIRPKEYHGEKDINQLSIPHVQEVWKCLEQMNYVSTLSWLGAKDFTTLNIAHSVEDTADNLAEEIARLVCEIYQILPPVCES